MTGNVEGNQIIQVPNPIDRPSREGGGGDRTLHVTYKIDRVGNLNTGTVNLHGNQNGEQ